MKLNYTEEEIEKLFKQSCWSKNDIRLLIRDWYKLKAIKPNVKCSDLLAAIDEIRDICENTDELEANYTDEQARNCDQALCDIIGICRAVKNDKS